MPELPLRQLLRRAYFDDTPLSKTGNSQNDVSIAI